MKKKAPPARKADLSKSEFLDALAIHHVTEAHLKDDDLTEDWEYQPGTRQVILDRIVKGIHRSRVHTSQSEVCRDCGIDLLSIRCMNPHCRIGCPDFTEEHYQMLLAEVDYDETTYSEFDHEITFTSGVYGEGCRLHSINRSEVHLSAMKGLSRRRRIDALHEMIESFDANADNQDDEAISAGTYDVPDDWELLTPERIARINAMGGRQIPERAR